MYNLSSSVQQARNDSATPEQLAKVEEIESYLTKNKVHEVLNVN